MIIKESVVDTLKKANNAAKGFVNDIENAYNYYSGNSKTKYSYKDKGTESDLRKTALKTYVKDLECTEILKDSRHSMLQVKFDARKAPKNLANRINPDHTKTNSCSLYDFIVSYDDHIVTMELPMDGGDSVKAHQQKMMDKRDKENNKNTKESIMVPEDKNLIKEGWTFIDSKSVLDSDGFYTDYTLYYDGERWVTIFGDNDMYDPENTEPDFESEDEVEAIKWFRNYKGFEEESEYNWEDADPETGRRSMPIEEDAGLELDIEEDVLEETPGLVLSVPQVKYRDAYDYDGYLEIEINGKKYTYVCKKDSDKRADEIASTVKNMQKHSDGKALAYLKKNMKLIESVLRTKDDLKNLEKEIKDGLYKVMTSPSFGYPDDEVNEYSGCKVIHRDDGIVKVEVWAEVGYNGLWDISEALNKIVQRYDSDSYFDMECAGRIEAFLNSNIKESVKMTESTSEGTEYKIITLKVRDEEDKIEDLLNCIKDTAYLGHSFPVVVDPENKDYRNEFYVDGDGSDKIVDISIEKTIEEGIDVFSSGHFSKYRCTEDELEKAKGPVTEGNSFKDHHLCQSCGNPLSKCTCEIKEEDLIESILDFKSKIKSGKIYDRKEYELFDDDKEELMKFLKSQGYSEDYDESTETYTYSNDGLGSLSICGSYLYTEATQVSNVGQRKSDSIDIGFDLKEESVEKGPWVIKVTTKDGSEFYYTSSDNTMSNSIKDATVYHEYDIAVDEFDQLHKSDYEDMQIVPIEI